jgi:phosphatidyl-myo-inositol dimannoside synthase
VVLSTSRLVPRKGVDTLIQACGRVSAEFPGLTVVVGSAGRDRPRLQKMAARCGADVRFLGRVSEDDWPGLYGCADVFGLCCRSRWWGLEQEGFGMVLLEAAAAGLPCITIDSGGAGEAVADGETGLVVKDVDEPTGWAPEAPRRQQVAAVAGALTRLLRAPELAAAMGRAGRARAEQHFSYDILGRRLANAIDEWH